jgi:hypothetical protein
VKRLATFALCAGLTALAIGQARVHSQNKTAAPRAVVVISLDGFPAYALDDPRLPIPTLRMMAREGVAAASMRPVNPTVTWPNHTAIVTGVDASAHHVLFNGLLTHPGAGAPPVVEPWRDKEQMVHAPTVYDLAFQAGSSRLSRTAARLGRIGYGRMPRKTFWKSTSPTCCSFISSRWITPTMNMDR